MSEQFKLNIDTGDSTIINAEDAKRVQKPVEKVDDKIEVPAADKFKKKYNLVEPNHPGLRKPVEKFDFNNPPTDPVVLAQDLVGHMRYFGGIGISANQLGLPYRVFCMEGEPALVCFNPVITGTMGEDVLMEEGCLTWPGFYLKKRRPSTIRVRFTDPWGDTVTKKFVGLSARIFLHEFEHMEGDNFLMGESDFKLRRARDKQQKMLRKLQRQQKALAKQRKQMEKK